MKHRTKKHARKNPSRKLARRTRRNPDSLRKMGRTALVGWALDLTGKSPVLRLSGTPDDACLEVDGPAGPVRLLVICTNEELAIARRVYSCLHSPR